MMWLGGILIFCALAGESGHDGDKGRWAIFLIGLTCFTVGWRYS